MTLIINLIIILISTCVPISILGLIIIIDTINDIFSKDEEVKDGKED